MLRSHRIHIAFVYRLDAAAMGKDVVFEWRSRNRSLSQRLVNQVARNAAKERRWAVLNELPKRKVQI